MGRSTRNGIVENVLRSSKFDDLGRLSGITFEQLMESRGWWQFEEAAELGDLLISSYVKYSPINSDYAAVAMINESPNDAGGAVSYAVFSRFCNVDAAERYWHAAIGELCDSHDTADFLPHGVLKLLFDSDYIGPLESVEWFERDFDLSSNASIHTGSSVVQQTL